MNTREGRLQSLLHKLCSSYRSRSLSLVLLFLLCLSTPVLVGHYPTRFCLSLPACLSSLYPSLGRCLSLVCQLARHFLTVPRRYSPAPPACPWLELSWSCLIGRRLQWR